MSRPELDRGSATVWTITAMVVVVLAASVATLVGIATLARHRAAAAADAAALRVAMLAIAGPGQACRAAVVIAARNHARLVRCSLDGADGLVTVQASLPGILARFGTATAHARAGPASEAKGP